MNFFKKLFNIRHHDESVKASKDGLSQLSESEDEITNRLGVKTDKIEQYPASNYIEIYFYACFPELFNIEDSDWESSLDGTEIIEIFDVLEVQVDRSLIVDHFLNGLYNGIDVFHNTKDDQTFVYLDFNKDPTDQNDMFFFGVRCLKSRGDAVHDQLLKIYKLLGTTSTFSYDDNDNLYKLAFISHSYLFQSSHDNKREIYHHHLDNATKQVKEQVPSEDVKEQQHGLSWHNIGIVVDPEIKACLDESLIWINSTHKKQCEGYYDAETSRYILNIEKEDYRTLFQIGYGLGHSLHTKNKSPSEIQTCRIDRIDTLQFDIISGDDKLIALVIEQYNLLNHGRFEIVDFDYDEVIFANIKGDDVSLSDILLLATNFGFASQIGRKEGTVDW